MKRIGIFSGSFDPVHEGHVALALQAIKRAKLDCVYFSPETKPRRKHSVTHFAHRVEMLRLATKDYPVLEVLELPDSQFSVAKTLPRLKHRYPKADLFFICGGDMLEHMPSWPFIERFLSNVGLIVGARDKSTGQVEDLLSRLPKPALETHIITSKLPHVSSRELRQAIGNQQKADGLLASTIKYIDVNWLYHQVP